METLESALRRFQAAQVAKFLARSERHPDGNVMIVGDSVLRNLGSRAELLYHFFNEVRELAENPTDSSEQIDVANMVFLLWWHDNPER